MIQISLLVAGWWYKKRNDDMAVKIWRNDWAGGGELDWNALDGRGEEEGGGLRGPVFFYLSMYVSTVCLSSVPVLRLSVYVSLPSCTSNSRHTVAACKLSQTCVTFWCHIPVVILLSEWQLVLSDISRTHTHKQGKHHSEYVCVCVCMRLSTVQPWAVFSATWSFFILSFSNAFDFHNKEPKVTPPSLQAVPSKRVTTRTWTAAANDETHMKVWSCSNEYFYVNNGSNDCVWCERWHSYCSDEPTENYPLSLTERCSILLLNVLFFWVANSAPINVISSSSKQLFSAKH